MKQVPTGFKDGFLWGGAVAACQIEGAYDVDGRGLSSSDIHAYDKNLDRANIAKEGGDTLAGYIDELKIRNLIIQSVMELIFITRTKVI